MMTVAPRRTHASMCFTKPGGMFSTAGTINSEHGQPASPCHLGGRAERYPEADSANAHWCRTGVTSHLKSVRSLGSTGRRNPATLITAAALPRKSLRVMSMSQPPRNQPVHGLGGVVELLITRVPVARLHFRDQPSVVTHFGHRGANSGPVVVTEKQIGVNTLIAAAAALLHHILQMDPRDSGSMNLDPLLRKSRVVDVADIEMNPHRVAVHVVQKLPELTRADEKPVFRVAILAADPDAGAPRLLAQRPERLDAALVHFVVGDFLGHQAGDNQNRVGPEQRRRFDLPLHDADRLGPDLGVAGGERRLPVQPGRDVGYHEAGAFDLPSERANLGVRGGHLKPGDVAQPQLDAVEAGLLDELQATLEAPVLRNHVVADGFLHGAS